MTSACGRWVIVFNGEIYNHGALRHDLDALGRVNWRGHSDTEVLLETIAAHGVPAALGAANGMFALAVWDRRERRLWLARDAFGEKPLYYGVIGGRLVFASELGAIEALAGESLALSHQALWSFLKYGYIGAPLTAYEGVCKLPPGTALTWREGEAPEIAPFWSLDAAMEAGRLQPFTDEREAADALEQLLLDAVGQRMVADVPLGAFLSGGIDSSLVTALMQAQSSRPVKTFTAGFETPEFNEAEHAAAVAGHLGTDHTEFKVTMADAEEVVPRLAEIFDEPFADASQIPTYLIARLARQHVTVCLTGDGGDEMFGGYVRYPGVPRLWRGLSRLPLRPAIAMAMAHAPMGALESVLAHFGPAARQFSAKGALGPTLKRVASWVTADSQSELYDRTMSSWVRPEDVLLDPERPAAGATGPDFGDAVEGLIRRDTLDYLPGDILCKVDRAAMASSLETRVPLLDPRIAAFAWRLPMDMKIRDGQGKWLLRQVLHRYVPQALTDRPKMGFTAPLHAWLTGDLRGWAEDLISPATLKRQGLLRPGVVRRLWARYLAGDTSVEARVWTVLMLQGWLAARGR